MALRWRMITVFVLLLAAMSFGVSACGDSGTSEVATQSPTPKASPTSQTPTLTPMFKSTADGSFFLEITSPEQSEVIVDKNSIAVAGRTTQDAAVSVNDSFVDVDIQGKFEKVVPLEDDINIIEVVASTIDGAQLEQVLTVIYSP